jgi:hypothetical protein
MKVGDIVSVPKHELVGIILDIMEMADGFLMCEVLHGAEIDWFDEIELRLREENGKDA